MADEIWIDVLPSMRGFGTELTKGAQKEAKAAGKTAGKEYSDAFQDSADGASNAAVAELETAQKRASGLVQKLSGDVSKARQAQQRSAAAALDAETKLATAVEKYGEGSTQAEAATLRLQAARGKAADDTQKFKNAEDALKSAQKSLTTTTEQLEKAQRESGQEADAAPKKWGKFTAALGTAGGKVKNFAKSIGGIAVQAAGAVGAAALISEAFGTSLEGETAVDRISAALGATPEQAEKYGAAAGALYSAGLGEGLDDVNNAVDAVVSSMGGMRDASQDEIEEVTGYALNLAKAMGVDVAEASTSAGALIKNGLASDATEAFDLITGAMQQVPQSLRGEVLPVIDEYGKHFQALGIDGNTAMGMIVAASSDGAIGMDKMGDALKEFTIRATDMSKSTSGVYETLGLDMEDMTNQLLAGGDTAEGAMAKIVHGLQGIKDPGQQAAASLALFGTPLEDLGTDQIPNFLGMVDPMGDAFDSLDGKAASMGDTLNDNTATSAEAAKRAFIGMLSDGITPLLGPATQFLNWVTETPGVLQGLGIALGVVAVAWAGVTLAASPWLAIAIGIGAGIAGLVAVIANWGDVVDWLRANVLDPFMGWLQPKWAALMGALKAGWDRTGKPVFDALGAAATWVWDKVLKPVFKWISEAWDNWTGHAKTVWSVTGKPVFDAVGAAGTFLWEKALKPVFGWIKDGWNGLWSGVKQLWEKVGKPTFDAVNSAGKFLWEKALKPTFKFVKDGWNSLTRAFGTVWDRYGEPVFSTISSLLKGDFPEAFRRGKEAVKNIWDGIANIVRKPVNFVVNTVYNNGLKALFNGIAGKLGLSWRLPDVDPLPAFAKGGLHKGGWALVGEEGPELVNFSAPGRVYTADETRAMLTGKEQAPVDALPMLTAGRNPNDSQLPIGGFWSSVWDGVTGAVGAAKDWVVGKIADGVRALTKPIKNTIGNLLPGAGINELIRGGAYKLIDDMVGWAIKKDDAKAAEQASALGLSTYDGPLGRFTRPSAGPFTSMFGSPRGRYPHAGVDIAGGGPTFSAWDGTVRKVGWNIVTGRTGIGILIDHGNGMQTYYGHNPSMGAVAVKPGDKVRSGQHIGQQGATGNATGVHLHFETWDHGTPVNPMKYLHDTGGIHEPGTWSYNGLSRPEVVFTEPQWATLHRLASRGASVSEIPQEITVQISVEDLEGIRTVEQFIAMARRRARQKKGS